MTGLPSFPDEPTSPDDLAALAADDALVDALGSAKLRPADDGDPVAGLLTAWRNELDEAAAAAAVGGLVQTQRWSRARRNTAGFIAGVVALAATTGVAAAASGPSGPGPLGELHRAIWGGGSAITPTAHDSATTAQVTRILDAVAAGIEAAQAAGGITASERTRRNGQLDDAAALLAPDPAAPAGLRQRLDSLRADLAALPPLSRPGSGSGPASAGTGSTDDGHQGAGTGHDGGGTDDASGSDSGSDDGSSGSGSDDGSTSGSDDSTDSSGSGSGSTSGSDDSTDSSGSGSGESDVGDSGSGSGTDDASSLSGGSDDGSSGSASGSETEADSGD
jgi:hypothetical protein